MDSRNLLNSKDLLKIIEAAKVSGLTYIKHGDLEMRFGAGDAAETRLIEVESSPATEILTSDEVQLINEQREEGIEEDLQSLQIDDPVRFEELLIEREIEIGGEEAP